MSFIVTILAFMVVLGITISIHEFGHFAMAKLLKIRVLTFSLGFGPRLLGVRRGGTDYRISAIPLGGYVKMAGENFDEDRQGSPDEFLSHPRWHRFLVAIAGPAMNIALAVGITTLSYVEGVRVPRYFKEPPVVGRVLQNSIANRAGLKPGDRILEIQGNSVHTWEEMEIAIGTAPKDDLHMLVARNTEQINLKFAPPNNATADSNSLGFDSSIPRSIVSVVDPGSPAEKAGLKPRDEIVKVTSRDRAGSRYDEILTIIAENKGVPLDFDVRRDSQSVKLAITPIEVEGRVRVGFVPEIPMDLEKYGLVTAIGRSVRRNYDLSVLVFRIIGRIFTGSASVKTLSGPIDIARISGDAARTGSPRVVLGLVALISLQLGVFNLLPIPILDGGVIALLLIEGIMRRDLSLAIKERIAQVGFVFLILLMGFVVFNDLSKFVNFEKLFR